MTDIVNLFQLKRDTFFMHRNPYDLAAQLEALEAQLKYMGDALITLTQAIAPRVDRTQLAERFGIHRNTLRVRLARDRTFPRPGADGRWLLSEVIEWELRGVRGNR